MGEPSYGWEGRRDYEDAAKGELGAAKRDAGKPASIHG